MATWQSVGVALLALVPGLSSAVSLFTYRLETTSTNGSPSLSIVSTVGVIQGQAGQAIRINSVGIGGDADNGSGDTGFQLSATGIDFTWGAGQTSTHWTYDLGTTPEASSAPFQGGRGMVFADVNAQADVGASVTVFMFDSFDRDGRYTYGSDPLGNFYNDFTTVDSSSVRVWVAYDYVAAIPEPSMWTLLLAGLIASAALQRMRRHCFSNG